MLAPEVGPAEGWAVRVAVVDASMADADSPLVAAVLHRVDGLHGATLDLDVPEPPPGRRWELQVHARPLSAGAGPGEDPQVRIGDAMTMVALPVRDALEMKAPVRPVRS